MSVNEITQSISEAITDGDASYALDQLATYHATLDLRDTDQNGETLLHVASKSGNATLVTALLAAGAPVDLGGHEGVSSPLASACFIGNLTIVDALLKAGARPEPSGPDASSPLHQAARQGSAPLVERLLDAGATVDALWYLNGTSMGTPLHLAVSNVRPAAVAALLRHGASLDALNGNRQTPMQVAHDPAIARMLVAHEQALLQRAIGPTGGLLPDSTVRNRL